MDAKARAVLAVALLVAASGVTPGEAARAQTPTTVVVVGVSDATTGQALQSAEVVFPELGRSGRTDGLGEARLAGIPIGSHRIRVRFIGYAAADTVLPFQGDTTGIVFRLERAAVTMDAVEVKASGPSRLRDFEARRIQGIGKFLTADQLAKEANRDFGVVAMTRFPGLSVVHDGDGRPHIASMRGSCGVGASPSEALRVGSRGGGSGGRGAATTGGSPTGVQGSGGAGSGSASTEPAVGTAVSAGSCTPNKACIVQTYLDDILLDEADFDIIETWDLAGVEYYSGAQVPVRYRISGAACGVLLLWSK
jgi:CarboxypepD_reg-like domain